MGKPTSIFVPGSADAAPLRSVLGRVVLADELGGAGGACVVRVVAEEHESLAWIPLLAEAAGRSVELRQRLRKFLDGGPELRCVDVETLPTTAAGEVRIRLKLSDGLAELVRAVRAGEFDLGIGEDVFHGGPRAG